MGKKLKIINGDVFVGGELVKADIIVADGVIKALLAPSGNEEFDGAVLDCAGRIILPGTIDTHVHIREPGSEKRETFLTGTAAAAAGGVTTIFEHPISNPPPFSPAILENRIRIAGPQLLVDCCFYGALGTESIDNIPALHKAGVVAFKTFLQAPMPGREREFEGLTISDDYNLHRAMTAAAPYGVLLSYHAENDDIIQGATARLQQEGRVDAKAHFESRPVISETECVAKLLHFAADTGARLEICHVSSAKALALLKEAKKLGLPVIVETCPHYIFTSEEESLPLGPLAKCNPPIRRKADVERIWDYINDGTVDIIGSDHAPYTKEEKERGYADIFKSPAGFPGLETRVPLLLDAVSRGKLSLAKMVELVCENPARLFGIDHRKGFIRPGLDADLLVVDMNRTHKVDKTKMYTKGRDVAGLYDGRELTGSITRVLLRGKTIMRDGVVDMSLAGGGEIVRLRPEL
ncbi:MAG: allantoinase AllB [bacterium]|jgi:allantoinase